MEESRVHCHWRLNIARFPIKQLYHNQLMQYYGPEHQIWYLYHRHFNKYNWFDTRLSLRLLVHSCYCSLPQEYITFSSYILKSFYFYKIVLLRGWYGVYFVHPHVSFIYLFGLFALLGLSSTHTFYTYKHTLRKVFPGLSRAY